MMHKTIQINGQCLQVPEGALAFKYADPTEGPRWVFDVDDLLDIRASDPSLLVMVVEEDEE